MVWCYGGMMINKVEQTWKETCCSAISYITNRLNHGAAQVHHVISEIYNG
jgi:hypothetical protein